MNLEETDFDYFLSLVDTANPKISMFDWLQYKFENGKLSLPDGELDDQKIELVQQALVFSSDIIEWWEKVFHKDWTLLRFNNQFGRFRTEIMAIQQTASVSTPSELNSSQRPSGHTVAKILRKNAL
ncbi:hypothetical protein HK098_008214 [Nowakowskiella sp. JEL0407]|nr:hypothetical protein HK098_008214 [Nowakowskiella sp. JEL0407]